MTDLPTTIHHATRKKAEKVGIMLSVHGEYVHALHAATGVECWEETAADAMAVNTTLMGLVETGAFYATQEAEGGDYVAYRMPKKKGDEPVARDPDLDDLLTTLDELETEEPEESDKGSVVPTKYKQMYRERGDETNCGDWLALLLKEKTAIIVEGKTRTDIDGFIRIALLNGIEDAQIAKLSLNRSNGWQGRLRMSVRNAMVRHIVEAGFIRLPKGTKIEKIEAPKAWIEDNTKAEKVKPAKAEPTPAPKPARKAKAKVDHSASNKLIADAMASGALDA